MGISPRATAIARTLTIKNVGFVSKACGIEETNHLLVFASVNDGSAFLAVVEVGFSVFNYICAFAFVVWTLHKVFSHSPEEAVFKRLLLVAWTTLT